MRLLLILGFLLVGLSACSNDSVAVGEVVEGHPGVDIDGTAAHVLLPGGELTITVGRPLDTLSASDSADKETHTAPSGGALIPLSYSFDATVSLPAPAFARRDPQVASVTAQVDGESVTLPEPFAVEGQKIIVSSMKRFYLAVDSPPLQSLEVTYDGLTQSVDPATGDVEPGAAALLYAADEPHDAPCETQVADSVDAEPRISCEATVQRVPYLPGHGWAEDPAGFVALGYRVRINDLSGYEVVGSPTVSSELAGRTPLAQFHDLVGQADSSGTYTSIDVFAPGSGEANIDLEFSVRRSGGQAGRPLVVRASVSVP